MSLRVLGVAGSLRRGSFNRALRQSFVFTNTCALLQPEVLVARAHEKIDAAGRVTDAATRELIAQLLAAFADWVPRVGTAAGATGAS